MTKGLIYAMAFALALAGTNPAMAKSKPQVPTAGFIKGSYICQLTGGFVVQPASTGLAQFTVDGKGNVTASAGELDVTIGGNSTNATPQNGTFFDNQYSFQRCDYSPSGGSYTLGASGTGTLSIDWTASSSNAANDNGFDCTGNITTNYDVLVSSPATLLLNSNDLVSDCTADTLTYAECGSSFSGVCQQQAKL
jgi:hypothetical protein